MFALVKMVYFQSASNKLTLTVWCAVANYYCITLSALKEHLARAFHPMARVLHLILLIVCVVTIPHLSEATTRGHVCKSPDCSDVVGDHMVKDNLHGAKHFNSEYRELEDHKEAARSHRSHINRRERLSAEEKKAMMDHLHAHHAEETVRIREGRPSRPVNPSASLSTNGASGDSSDLSD